MRINESVQTSEYTQFMFYSKIRKSFSPFNSGDDLTDKLFVATIQTCDELVFLCLQNSFVGVSIICGATRFAIIELKFNIKQEGSWVLGRSPDMTIRKVREKQNHSQH